MPRSDVENVAAVVYFPKIKCFCFIPLEEYSFFRSMFWTFRLNLLEGRMGKLERRVGLFYFVLPVLSLIAAHFLHFLEVGGNPRSGSAGNLE